jgi:hypothetical protein
MNTDKFTNRVAAIVFTAFLVWDSSASVVKAADGANKRAQEPSTFSAAVDESGKIAKKPSSLMKRLFKDFRAGPCRTAVSPTPPNTSWAPCGEAAVSVCRS